MRQYNLIITMSALFLLNSIQSVAQESKHKSLEPQKRVAISLKDVKSKELTLEFPCEPNATIFLENIFRRVNIVTANDNKVRLVTTVYYQGDPSYTDAEWLQKLELGISGNAGNVVVKSGDLKSGGDKVVIGMPSKSKSNPNTTDSSGNRFHKKSNENGAAVKAGVAKGSIMEITVIGMPANRRPDTAIANGIAVFDSSGNWVNRKSNIRRNITLYVPAGVKLDIESKYADITLENNVKTIKARLTNGGLTMKDADQLIVNGVYGNLYCGNIGYADIDLTNGRFRAGNIPALDFKSSNSVVELNTVNQMTLNSSGDNIDIEELGSVKGQKNYGDLRITFLKSMLDIAGKNADLKIRSIDPGVSLLKIDDQYADLRLPVGNLKNYTVNFEGTGGNMYASFEKVPVKENSFRATMGDITAKPTNFQLKCDNCTVDFK